MPNDPTKGYPTQPNQQTGQSQMPGRNPGGQGDEPQERVGASVNGGLVPVLEWLKRKLRGEPHEVEPDRRDRRAALDDYCRFIAGRPSLLAAEH